MELHYTARNNLSSIKIKYYLTSKNKYHPIFNGIGDEKYTIANIIASEFDKQFPIAEPKLEIGQTWLFYTGRKSVLGKKFYRAVTITGTSYKLGEEFEYSDDNYMNSSMFANESDYIAFRDRDKTETFLIKNEYGCLWPSNE